tara:strand:- start:1579 stop:2505 length:927 start_codon:yes stop_codon:yes gene_type:complete
MIKKIFFISLFLFNFTVFGFSKSVFISVMINDKIITNLDIEKESEYLKIFNPNLNNLEKKKILELAKNSLINEVIKKAEINKKINFNDENPFVDDYLKNIYTGLNYTDEKEFEIFLKKKKIYSLNEIKEKIKIEVLWNELIYLKYNNLVKIDKAEISSKINKLSNETKTEYLLSEIVFEKKKEDELQPLINKINLSIKEIGFNNTANIYSISDSAKFGGKIGWISQNNLSEQIFNKLNEKSKGDFTDIINIGNNYLILKIEDIKEITIEVDKNEETKKMIKFETNKQLNQFSRIFFNKARLNYSINEK